MPGDSDAPGELFALPGRARDTRRLIRAPDARGRDRSDRFGGTWSSQPCNRCGGTGGLRLARLPHVRWSEASRPGRTGRRRSGRDCRRRAHPRGGQGTRWFARRSPGELIVDVHVDPHRLFAREGDDLHVDVPVAIHEAALGARIEVPTLRARPGCEYQQVPSPASDFASVNGACRRRRDGRSGDLVVEVRLVLPRCSTSGRRSSCGSSGELHPENVRRELLEAAESSSARRE